MIETRWFPDRRSTSGLVSHPRERIGRTWSPARTLVAAVVAVVAFSSFSTTLRAEEARLGSGVEVRVERIVADHRFEDALGVKIDFRYRVGRVETDKALFLIASATVGGEKVRSLSKSAQYRDRDGFLHGKKQLVSVPRNTWRRDTMFIPYYTLKLAPGGHRLDLHFEARSDTGSCKTGELPRRYRVLGDQEASVDIQKPAYKMVQLLARRIEVAHVATDSAFLLRWKARPDLQWQVRFRAGSGGVIHNSRTRDNAWTGTWTRYTEPFPFSEGDRMTLTVFDEDFMGDDVLGRFTFTLDDLLSLGPNPPARSNDKVKVLQLAPVKIR